MKKILKGMSIVSVLLGNTVAADAQDAETKDGFLRRAFRDMMESAKLQHRIDKANLQAVKLESQAFYQEQKRLSKPSVRAAAEKEKMQKELEAANQRIAEAQARTSAVNH